MEQSSIVIGRSAEGEDIVLSLAMANRHGLIAGATGTGKTVTLQRLAGEFSRAGVPVFLADVKGDLRGLGFPGELTPRIQSRLEQMDMTNWAPQPAPVCFWDIDGALGHPIRTTISELGPLLIARLVNASDVQASALEVAFRLADDQGLLLLDLKDLQATLEWMGEHPDEVPTKYGRITRPTIGALQRGLLTLETAGLTPFLGEPALRIEHLMRSNENGHGLVNILDARRIVHDPRSYSTVLLWLLSELFETLPEAGDSDKPKLVFFFDEAHLLFEGAPRILLEKVEQVVRLIRSRGVGIFFVTQYPTDIPDVVLGQLGCRVQHALRVFTERDQRAARAAAVSFRANPTFSTKEALPQLGVGEALVSTLDTTGAPSVVQRTLIAPPTSRIGTASDEEVQQCLRRSMLSGIYDTAIDRESAAEMLQRRMQTLVSSKEEEKKTSRREGFFEAFLKSAVRSIASQVGRQIARGVLGSVSKGR